MSLAQLLASSDSGVRSRAIAMLASILETQPLAILSSFGTYMPFFLSALRNRAQDSVTFCTLNELLVEAIMAKSAEVEPNSRVLLVEYLSRCLARAVDSGRVNAFVRHMFEGVAEGRKLKGRSTADVFRVLVDVRLLDEELCSFVLSVSACAEKRPAAALPHPSHRPES